MLQNFINKIYVFKDRVEIFLNIVPYMLCGHLDFEINNQDVMTMANFNQKYKVVENEKGIYDCASIYEDKKQPDEPVAGSVAPTNKGYGGNYQWLPV